MFSEYEVECLYLGKPFEEKVLQLENPVSRLQCVSEEDIERLRSTLPLLSALVESAYAMAG